RELRPRRQLLPDQARRPRPVPQGRASRRGVLARHGAPARSPGHDVSDAVQQRLDVEAAVVSPTVDFAALSLLVVEDSVSDERLILEALVDAGADRNRVSCVATLRDARQALIERPVSCVLLDLSLPDASGLESVTLLSAAAPDTPVVIVTG